MQVCMYMHAKRGAELRESIYTTMAGTLNESAGSLCPVSASPLRHPSPCSEMLAFQALGRCMLGLDRQVSAFRPGLPWSSVLPIDDAFQEPLPTVWCPPHSAKCPCFHPGCRRSRETPRQSLPEEEGKPFCFLELGFSQQVPGSMWSHFQGLSWDMCCFVTGHSHPSPPGNFLILWHCLLCCISHLQPLGSGFCTLGQAV